MVGRVVPSQGRTLDNPLPRQESGTSLVVTQEDFLVYICYEATARSTWSIERRGSQVRLRLSSASGKSMGRPLVPSDLSIGSYVCSS